MTDSSRATRARAGQAPAISQNPHNHLTTLVIAACATFTACGGESTGVEPVPGRPGITIIGGSGVSDTIEAILAEPLRFVVRNNSGDVMARTLVTIHSIPAPHPSGIGVEERVFVAGGVDGTQGIRTGPHVTSDDGTIAVRIRLGRVPGPGSLLIRETTTGFTDTARFSVTHGRRAGVAVSPRDSAFTVGASLTLRTTAIDRAGNPVPAPEPLSFRALDPALSVSSDGVVRASVHTRGAIVIVSGPAKPETAWVSVVPRGTFAARFNNSFGTQALDGSGRRVAPAALKPHDPEWSRDGASFLMKLGMTDPRLSLYRVTIDGTASLLLSSTPTPDIFINGYINTPIHSFAQLPDGSIIAAINSCFINKVLYRFTGTGASMVTRRISPPVPSAYNDCYDTVQSWPSPSPDGARVVYQNDSTSVYHPPTIEIRTLATGALTKLAVVGEQPRWSPVGDLIAYVASQQLWVIRADGSGNRVVSQGGRIVLPGVSWSPDGRFLMTQTSVLTGRGFMHRLAIVEVATGLELPLAFTLTDSGVSYGRGAWSPIP